jgi:hypothetical protein
LVNPVLLQQEYVRRLQALNKLIALILTLLLVSCSTTRVSEFQSILIKKTSGEKQLTVLKERVSGEDCSPSVKEYAINEAIKRSLTGHYNNYKDAIGLANVKITQNVGVFLINLSRCFVVSGQPIVEK